MIQSLAIALVDLDTGRRAQIAYAGSQAGLHIEPFENATELRVAADQRAVLVHDDGQNLAATFDCLNSAGCWLPIVAYKPEPTATRVAEAIFGGVIDYLAWPFSPGDLRLSLERVRDRTDVVGERRSDAAKAKSRIKNLSGREIEVINGMARGLSNKAIASHLQISPRTVEIYRSNAICKLGVSTSTEAIILAFTATQDTQ